MEQALLFFCSCSATSGRGGGGGGVSDLSPGKNQETIKKGKRIEMCQKALDRVRNQMESGRNQVEYVC